MRGPILALAALCALPLSAQQVNDTKYGFTAHVPDGFKAMPAERRQMAQGMIHAFYMGDLDDAEPDAVITFTHLGGTIGREGMNVKEIAREGGFTNAYGTKQKWKEFDVDVMVATVSTSGIEFRICMAQIPLLPEAIQVNVGGPPGNDAEILARMEFILEHMDGKTNWLTGSERAERLGDGIAKMAIFGALVIGGVIFIVRRSIRKRREAAQRTLQQPGGMHPYGHSQGSWPQPGLPAQYPPQYPQQYPPHGQSGTSPTQRRGGSQ